VRFFSRAFLERDSGGRRREYRALIDGGENGRVAGEAGRKAPGAATIMELAILWLLCAAVFLELADSAPEVD